MTRGVTLGPCNPQNRERSRAVCISASLCVVHQHAWLSKGMHEACMRARTRFYREHSHILLHLLTPWLGRRRTPTITNRDD